MLVRADISVNAAVQLLLTVLVCCYRAQQDDKEKDRMKAGLTGAILSEKPNVKVRRLWPAERGTVCVH